LKQWQRAYRGVGHDRIITSLADAFGARRGGMLKGMAKIRSGGLASLIALGLVSMPLAAVNTVCGTYLPRFLAGLGMSFVAVAAAISLVRLLDIGLDPFIALMIDRTDSRIGRYRPWLIAGVPIVLVGLVGLLQPHQTVDIRSIIVWLLVVYAGLSMILLSVSALGAKLAPGYADRSRFYAFCQAAAVMGPICLALLPIATHGRLVVGKPSTMPVVALVVGGVLIVTVLALVVLLREPPVKGASQVYRLADYLAAVIRPSMGRVMLADFLLTLGHSTAAPLYVFFFHDAKSFTLADTALMIVAYKAAGLLGAPTWARVANRFGKSRAAQAAAVGYAITQAALLSLPHMHKGYHWADMAPTVLALAAVGFCVCAFPLLAQAMVADIADEAKLEKGHDVTTLLFSMISTTTKVASSLSVMVTFPILQIFGYNAKEGAINSAHALHGLELCYVAPPIALVLLGGLALIGYPLDARRHRDIVVALDHPDEGLASLA
jgi:GPH family glycoside/pentoside/hexuronide:cation symporter